MNKKKRNLLLVLFCTLFFFLFILWISGVIPKQIAIISSTHYLKKNFPKIQLEYENIEWSSTFGDYIITFKDEDNEIHGFCIGPKYFPVRLGQGLFGFQEIYRKEHEEQVKKDNIDMEIKKETLTKDGATIIITNKMDSQIGYGTWFRIDKKQEGEWIEAEIKNKNYIFNAIAYRIKERSNSEEKIDWSNLYGTLNKG